MYVWTIGNLLHKIWGSCLYCLYDIFLFMLDWFFGIWLSQFYTFQIESNLEIQQLRSRVAELESRGHQSKACVDEFSNGLLLNLQHPEGLIYLIGGFDETSWLAGLDSYSPSNDKITPLQPMSFPRSYACATALDGDIYVIGGGINGDRWFNTGIITCSFLN